MIFKNQFPIENSIAELLRPHFGKELQYSQEFLQMTSMRFCLRKILKETDHMYFRIPSRGLTSLLRSVTFARLSKKFALNLILVRQEIIQKSFLL